MSLVIFFWFGAAMGLLSLLALALPDGALASVWRIKPEARHDLQSLGLGAFLLISVVGLACALAALGLVRRREWGRRLAIAVLAVNLLGDSATAFARHDYRTLIGLPIGGALIASLVRVRQTFRRQATTQPGSFRAATSLNRTAPYASPSSLSVAPVKQSRERVQPFAACATKGCTRQAGSESRGKARGESVFVSFYGSCRETFSAGRFFGDADMKVLTPLHVVCRMPRLSSRVKLRAMKIPDAPTLPAMLLNPSNITPAGERRWG